MHRPGVAEQIDYEGTAQSIVDTLVSQQFARVKEVAWMLAVKRSYDFSRIEVSKGYDLHLSKSKSLLHCLGDAFQFRIKDAAA